jgi:hypothetical protein
MAAAATAVLRIRRTNDETNMFPAPGVCSFVDPALWPFTRISFRVVKESEFEGLSLTYYTFL